MIFLFAFRWANVIVGNIYRGERMVLSGKCLVSTALFTFWAIYPFHQVYSADEIDKMLVVESPVLNAVATNDAGNQLVAPVVKPAEALLPAATQAPAAAAVKPAETNQTAIIPQQPSMAPKMVPGLPDPAIVSLRLELMLREQELAKSNKEVERLKDIVRKIHEASRRESLVFHYNVAAIYRSNMMYKKAEESYLKALEIDPRDAGVHYNLAILYDDNFKDKKKAKYHYEKFLELAPEDADAPKVREWLSSIL